MERISGDGFFSYRRVGRDESKRGKRTKPSGSTRSFRSELDKLDDSAPAEPIDRSSEESDAEAAELLDAVFQAGDRLKRQSDAAALRTYREAVQRFLSLVVTHGLGVEHTQSGSDVLKRKRYALIRVIDDKLDRLATAMLANQRNQLELLAKIDEITGLLVDLRR